MSQKHCLNHARYEHVIFPYHYNTTSIFLYFIKNIDFLLHRHNVMYEKDSQLIALILFLFLAFKFGFNDS